MGVIGGLLKFLTGLADLGFRENSGVPAVFTKGLKKVHGVADCYPRGRRSLQEDTDSHRYCMAKASLVPTRKKPHSAGDKRAGG